MRRSHFKYFFETYFKYPYEKLEFEIWESDSVRKMIANSYECPPDDVDCFYFFTKVLNCKEIQYYGFYRIKESDFYIPFFAHWTESIVTPHVEIIFNYNMANSVFDCKHIPLRNEKTLEFYSLIMDNIQPFTKKILQSSGLFTLTEPFKRSLVYFDFDFSRYTLEVENKGFNFNETFTVRYRKDNPVYNTNTGKPDVFIDFISCRYEIGYYVAKKFEQLVVDSTDVLKFTKAEMLHQSFSGMDSFEGFEYTNINELDALVKEFRKVEKMYLI